MRQEKEKIIKGLEKQKKKIQVIVDGLRSLDSDDLRTNREAIRTVVFTLFELVDELTNLEADIYNFFRRRDEHELCIAKQVKRGAREDD